MRSGNFFLGACSAAAIIATCSLCAAESEDGPLNYLPSNTVFAFRAGDLIGGMLGDVAAVLRRAALAPEQIGIDETAGMLASAGAMSGVDLNGEIVAAVTMSDRPGAPTLPLVDSIFASPQLSLLLLLPCRDVNALPMALGMAGYSPDASSGGSGGLLLVHDSLPTLALSQWAPGVVAAAVAAAPLRPGETVEGPGVCSPAAGSGCSVIAVNADGTVSVRPLRSGNGTAESHTYVVPAAVLIRGGGAAGLATTLGNFVGSLPAPLRPLLPMLERLLPLGRVPPPAPPAADARLRLPRALRAAARNSAVSLIVHPRGADPALRPLLAALRAGAPLLRMAAAAAAALGTAPLPAAAASALGALVDAAADAGLTVLEDTDAIVLALGRSTGFGHASSTGGSGSGVQAAHDSAASPGSAAATTGGAAGGPAGIRFEAALAARRNTSLSRTFAAAPASPSWEWEDLMVGLPADVPSATYVAASGNVDPSVSSGDAGSAKDAAAAGAGKSSLLKGIADAASAALAPHVRSLQSDASPLSRLLLLLFGEDGGILPATLHLLEGAQLAVLRSDGTVTSADSANDASHGFVALLPGNGASTAAAVLRLHSAAAQAAALAVDTSMPWAAGWVSADIAAAASAQMALSAASAAGSAPMTTVTFPLAGGAAALDASFTFSSAAQRSVAGISFERRGITLSLSNSSAGCSLSSSARPPSYLLRLLLQLLLQHSSIAADLHVGMIPETQQCILFSGLSDAAAAAFIDAARARPAAVAAARAAAAAVAAERQLSDAADADAAEEDEAPVFNFEEAGLDPEMAAAFASAIAAATDRSKDGSDASSSSGSKLKRELEDADNPYGDAGRAIPLEAAAAVPSGGYSARADVAAAVRAAHPRKSSIATIQLRSAVAAACAAIQASTSLQWLADVCSAAAGTLSATSPMTVSTAVDGAIASVRLAIPVPTHGA